jgi:hypothetical protein
MGNLFLQISLPLCGYYNLFIICFCCGWLWLHFEHISLSFYCVWLQLFYRICILSFFHVEKWTNYLKDYRQYSTKKNKDVQKKRKKNVAMTKQTSSALVGSNKSNHSICQKAKHLNAIALTLWSGLRGR